MRSFRHIGAVALLATCALVLLAATHSEAAYKNPVGGSSNSSSSVCYSHWQSVGPFAVNHAMSIKTDPADIGAAQDVWVNGDTAFLASVNGGVWRSTSFHTYDSLGGPHWEPVTDSMHCASIASVSGSPDDPNVVAAGCGFVSSSGRRGGEPMGAMITLDGGNTWEMTSFPSGYDVSSVLVAGLASSPKVVVAARGVAPPPSLPHTRPWIDPYNATGSGGIWYSADGEASFTNVYSGNVTSMARVPTLAHTLFATTLNPAEVVLISDSTHGASWAATPAQPIVTDECAAQFSSLQNSKVAVTRDQVTVTTIAVGLYLTNPANATQACWAFFFSRDKGASWRSIRNAPAMDGGLSLDTHGSAHFAMVLPFLEEDMLFVAGSGRAVFKVNIVSFEWALISTLDSDPLRAAATQLGTAPHSNARHLVWDDHKRELLVTNDGGLYRRTAPWGYPSSGDWFSLAGDLAISEVHQAAVDPATGAMILAVQDNGMMLSQWDGSEASTGKWSSLFADGDGVSVGVDTSVSPARLIGANQHLASLLQVNWTGQTNNALGNEYALFNASAISFWSKAFAFHTKLAINLVAPSQTLVCTQQAPSGAIASLCMSLVFPDDVKPLIEFSTDNPIFGITSTDFVRDYAYGGRRHGTDNAEVVFAVGATFVWARDVADASTPPTPYTNACIDPCRTSNMVKKDAPWQMGVAAIAQHPRDYYVNLVIDDAGHCWLTSDFGQTWIDLNLPAHSNLLNLSEHTSVDTFHTGAAIFVDVLVGGVQPLVIGTPFGSFVTFDAPNSTSFVFHELGANQPHTIPSSYSYQRESDTLTMAMLGRGVWQMQAASVVLAQAARDEPTTALNPACTRPLYPNLPGVVGYSADPTPAPIGFPDSSSSPSSSTGTTESSSSTGDASTGNSSSGNSSSGHASSGDASSSSGTDSASTGDNSQNHTSSSTGAGSNETSFTGSHVNDTSSTGSHTNETSSTGQSNDASTGASRNETSSTGVDLDSSSSTGSHANETTSTGVHWDSSSSTGAAINCRNVTHNTTVTINGTAIVNGTVTTIECDEVVPPSSSTGDGSSGSSGTDWSSTGDETAHASSSSTGADGPSSTGADGPITPAQSSSASVGPSDSSTGGGPDSGGSTDSSSSTGGASPSIVVPESLPVFELTLGRTLEQLDSAHGGVVQFGRAAVHDLAAACQVPEERVLLLNLEAHPDDAGAVLLRFTLSDRLVDTQLRSQVAGRFFLDAAKSPSFAWGASLVSIQAGSGALAADQSVVNKLPLISFRLAYNMGGLPGGNLVRFSGRLVDDIAKLCGVSKQRIAVQRVLAGSVQATFVVAPPVDSGSEPATALVADRFIEGLNNQTSSFYTDSDVAAAAIVGSGRVGTPGAPPPAPVPADTNSGGSSGFMDSPGEIGLVVGLVIGGLLIGAGVIWLVFKTVLKPKPAPKVQDRKPAVQLSSIAVQDPPRAAAPVTRSPLPATTKLPPLNKPLGAGDVRLTLANGYGPVRPLLSPSAGGGPGAKPVTPEDTAHFTLSDDVGAQPYFAGAPTVVAGSGSSGPAPYGARPASPGLSQSPASPQGGAGSGAAHPALSRARSPNSFRIMYSSKKKALPSMLPGSSPSAAASSASPQAAAALSPLGSPSHPSSSSYSPASSSAATYANSDAAMRLKMRQAANNVSGSYSNNGRSAY